MVPSLLQQLTELWHFLQPNAVTASQMVARACKSNAIANFGLGRKTPNRK